MKPPIVTDHAVLRYLERVHGVDLEGLRRRIAGIVVRAELSCALGGASAVRTMGVRFVIRDGYVTTVEPMSMPVKRGRRRGARRTEPA